MVEKLLGIICLKDLLKFAIRWQQFVNFTMGLNYFRSSISNFHYSYTVYISRNCLIFRKNMNFFFDKYQKNAPSENYFILLQNLLLRIFPISYISKSLLGLNFWGVPTSNLTLKATTLIFSLNWLSNPTPIYHPQSPNCAFWMIYGNFRNLERMQYLRFMPGNWQ